MAGDDNLLPASSSSRVEEPLRNTSDTRSIIAPQECTQIKSDAFFDILPPSVAVNTLATSLPIDQQLVSSTEPENDLFSTPSQAQHKTRLSPTASAFNPYAGSSRALEETTPIAAALSAELGLSRCLRLSSEEPSTAQDIKRWLDDLELHGHKFHGRNSVTADANKAYIHFNDIRDACSTLTTILLSVQRWKVEYCRSSPMDQKIVDSFTGQILLVATPASCNSNVDQTVRIARNFLHSYGQLFAFIRVSNSSTRSLRAIAEFCDIAHCMKILSNCTHVTTPEGVRLVISPYGFCQDFANRTPISDTYHSVRRNTLGYPQSDVFSAISSTTTSEERVKQPLTMYPLMFQSPLLANNATRITRSAHLSLTNNHNFVDVMRIREGIDVRTTIMLRNIPNKVDQSMLKSIIDESSWGKYDFMYLRIDFANDCNVGYAFINFVDPLDIIYFVETRANQRWNCFKSDKVAEISYATIQGKDCLVQKFRNSSVMLEAPHYRPKLYYTSNGPRPGLAGQEEPFPDPDNQSKMKRSCENAEHVGLFTPNAGQHYRDEQRRRRSQYDRGTRLAALEEYDYDAGVQTLYNSPL
ncbi:uncharacterized protein UV8b_03737 [Ustilaginoidea virens]|uniref:RRM domain-containing protein n=1 Tax=Ustilaginoidea virens TaxID=1159556 RepID=A0A8E5HQ22_USTVR|nr:uncharacterized protein UV8b_03737 [Ustilaginoidea virens]QUC19496.1 hypothetical protein UV8b_03737 [Ustilaginoidea virens]